MKERTSQLSPTSHDQVSRYDIFSQVMGDDRHGRVRMFGHEVAPSDLWGDLPSRSTCHRMAMEQINKVAMLEERFKDQEERFKRQEESLNELKAMLMQQFPHGSPNQSRMLSSSSTHMPNSMNNNGLLRVGAFVSLKSASDPSKIVAKGYLRSLDPSKEIGGLVLGKSFCEVDIQIMVDRDKELIRPYGFFYMIGDALGAPIGWPRALVTICDD